MKSGLKEFSSGVVWHFLGNLAPIALLPLFFFAFDRLHITSILLQQLLILSLPIPLAIYVLATYLIKRRRGTPEIQKLKQ